MKKIMFIISLFLSLVIIPLYSQTYDPADSSALRLIQRNCDSNGTLNWESERDPGKWTGVTWDNSVPKRVSMLELTSKKLSGSLDVMNLTNLLTLECGGSEGLEHYNNKLTSLYISGLVNLQNLDCSINPLSSLDISSLTNLKSLDCHLNPLTKLDVLGLNNLQSLNCNCIQLTSLNVSTLINLQFLDCGSNQLSQLDVSSLTKLNSLNCTGNQLTSLDVSNLTNLNSLNCSGNQLTSLAVSNLTNLNTLNCSYNQLTRLDVSVLKNLEYLYCDGLTRLTSLDISNLPNLQELGCSFGQLSSLNASGCSNLIGLNCYDDRLTSINVSGCIKLQGLMVPGNQIVSLDLSGLTSLKNLDCSSNRLPSVNVSQNTQLSALNCTNNKIPFSSLPILNISYYYYDPQDSIFTSSSIMKDTTIDYSAEALINKTATNFVFYKNNEKVTANTTGLYTTTGPGIYYCKMTNSVFGSLILTTASITFWSVLSVFPSTLTIKAIANNVDTFNITSNTEWNAVSSESWLTVNPASGLNNGTIYLTATANPDTTLRLATVTISGSAVIPKTITVTQKAKDVTAVTELYNIENHIYPNPVIDKVNIWLSSGDLPAVISLYDINGKQLMCLKSNITLTEIEMSRYAAGLYILMVRRKEQTIEKRILIKM